MEKPDRSSSFLTALPREAWLIFACSLFLHFWNIGYGLPGFFNPDEPHNLNLAAHFGTGDLNPHDFKYPTLWPYVVSVILGILFVAGRFAGLIHSSKEFAEAFLCRPTTFYLVVRVFAALLVSSTALILYRLGRRLGSRTLAVTLALLGALTPILSNYGREGTPYNLMIFLMASLTLSLQNLQDQGRLRDYVLSGVLAGLAVSTHFTAAPMSMLLISMHLSRRERNHAFLVAGIAVAAFAFFAASPYLLLDFRSFRADMMDLHQLERGGSWGESAFNPRRLLAVFANVARCMDPWGIGAVLVLVFLASEIRRRRFACLAWLAPLVLSLPALTFSHYGALERYNLSILFPFLLLAARGLTILLTAQPSRLKTIVLCAAIFLPLAAKKAADLREQSLPDTRSLTKAWVEANVPSGEKLFISDHYRCPQFPMTAAQVRRLMERAEAMHHPRADYYRLLLDGCGGSGGYEIYYLLKTVHEGQDLAGRTNRSYAAQDVIDADHDGAKKLVDTGIRFLILETALPAAYERLRPWAEDLKKYYTLRKEFTAVPGKTAGPDLSIYELTSPRPASSIKTADK